MKILNSIINFFKKNPRIIEYVVIFLIVWFVAVVPAKNTLKEERAARAKFEQTMINNVNALQDSVRRKINENGEIVSEKLGYAVSSIEDLKQYDQQLYKELRNSDKDLKNYINSEVQTILTKVGETKGEITQESDSSFNLSNSYNYSDSGLTHSMKWETPLIFENGLLQKGNTRILKNEFNINLSYETIRTEDGKSKVVAKSPSEYVYFNNLNSVYIDENLNRPREVKSRLGVGPTLGIGTGYIGDGWKIFPYAGIGINWNVWTIKRFE